MDEVKMIHHESILRVMIHEMNTLHETNLFRV
jgi:hypothetical protein